MAVAGTVYGPGGPLTLYPNILLSSAAVPATLSGWGSVGPVIEGRATSVTFGGAGGAIEDDLNLNSNAYFTGTLWKRKAAHPAANIILYNGEIRGRVAANGAADATITWLTPFLINVAGRTFTGDVITDLSGGNITTGVQVGMSNSTAYLALGRNTGHASSAIGSIPFYNGAGVLAGEIWAGGDGATDSGKLVFYTRPTGGTSTARLTILSTGYIQCATRFNTNRAADVASASTLTLNAGNYQLVSGTTTIDYITTTGWAQGAIVTLRFSGSLTVTHNAGSVPANTQAIRLQGAANFSATNGAHLTLCYDGSNWEEVCRRTA